jgi:hypothetical protein
MKYVNLTPNELNIDGVGLLPSSGVTARVTHTRDIDTPLPGPLGPVRVIQQNFGPVGNIPQRQDGTVYIISAVVMSAILARGDEDPLYARLGVDIYAPDTGPDATREGNQVRSVRGLVW